MNSNVKAETVLKQILTINEFEIVISELDVPFELFFLIFTDLHFERIGFMFQNCRFSVLYSVLDKGYTYRFFL